MFMKDGGLRLRHSCWQKNQMYNSEIMLMTSENRDTEYRILDVLTKKYGSNHSSDPLREYLFDCKLSPGEGIVHNLPEG